MPSSMTKRRSRSRSEVAASSDPAPWRRLSQATFVTLFFAVVLLSAVPLGANREWAWSPLVVVLGGLAVWHAAGLGIVDGHGLRVAERRYLVVLLLCFAIVIAMGLFQISTLMPAAWRSPFYGEAATILGRPIAAIRSIDAEASLAILMKIAACGAIFVMARSACRDRRRARLFLFLFLASAVLVAGYGLVMHATTNSCYVFNYFKRPTPEIRLREFGCVFSGTFVSSNSFATYAGMALVAALGLAASRPRSNPTAAEKAEVAVGGATWFTGSRVACIAIVLLLFGTLLLSRSRAGFVATVVSAVLLGFVMLRGRWSRSMSWVVVAAIVVAAALALATGGAFFHKAANLSDADILGRFRIWQLTALGVQKAPWLGWGLGSFPDVYYLLQPADLQIWIDKAHSTPLEWLLELGIPVGLAAFALVVLPLIVCLRGAWRRRTDRYLPAIAFAAPMVAILHSTVDFSLQMPAIGFVVSALLGLGWAQGFRRDE
jgi:hypothetical protein